MMDSRAVNSTQPESSPPTTDPNDELGGRSLPPPDNC